MHGKADIMSIAKRSTEHNLHLAMDSSSWKKVTKSPAALKSKILIDIVAFKKDLKMFRDEMTLKKQT